MIGLILLYFLGKSFYELAAQYEKPKWLYAILGIAVYYASSFLFGLVYAMISIGLEKPEMMDIHDLLLGLIALPFSLLMVWLFYRILKKTWSRGTFSEIIDDGNV